MAIRRLLSALVKAKTSGKNPRKNGRPRFEFRLLAHENSHLALDQIINEMAPEPEILRAFGKHLKKTERTKAPAPECLGQ